MNSLGYEFLRDGKAKAALKIYTIAVSEFPKSGNAYDRRGEAYFELKDYARAKADCLESLELDPANQSARDMLLKIQQIIDK